MAAGSLWAFTVAMTVLAISVSFAASRSADGGIAGVKRWWASYRQLVAKYMQKEAERVELAGNAGGGEGEEGDGEEEEDASYSRLSAAGRAILAAKTQPKWWQLRTRFAKWRKTLLNPASFTLLRAALRAPLLHQLLDIAFSSLRTWLLLHRASGMGFLVDQAVRGALTPSTAALEVLRVFLMLLAEICMDASQMLVSNAVGRSTAQSKLCGAFLRSIFKQDLPFLTHQKSWMLCDTMYTGSRAIERALTPPLSFVKDLITLVLLGAAALRIDWQLAVVIIVVRIGLGQYVSRWLDDNNEFLYQLKQSEVGRSNNDMYSLLADVKSYQLFACEDAALRKVNNQEEDAASRVFVLEPMDKANQHATKALNTVSQLIIHVFGAFRIVLGSLTMGRYTQLQTLEGEFMESLQRVRTASTHWQRGIKSSRMFFRMLTRSPQLAGDAVEPTAVSGDGELAAGAASAAPASGDDTIKATTTAPASAPDAKPAADSTAAVVGGSRAATAAPAAKTPAVDPIPFIDAALVKPELAAALVDGRKLPFHEYPLADLSLHDVVNVARAKMAAKSKAPSSTATSSTSASAVGSAPAPDAVTSAVAPSGARPARITGKVEFRGVSFKYPAKQKKAQRVGWWEDLSAVKARAQKEQEEEEKRRKAPPVLDNVSFAIEAGTSCALVGKSGAGKTTSFQLLLRFYDPSRGTILVDDVDIRTMEPATLRRQIGCVEQEPRIFPGTALENLCFGFDPTDADYPTMEEVERACRLANIHEVISAFPSGYQEILGSSGRELSGGQRQRLSIARVFLRNPSILLLDEVTAAQDVESEVEIQAGIKELMKGRTVIMIAHRLKTIEHCQQILLLHDGKILERGNHGELYRLNGKYRWMVDAQAISRPGDEATDGAADTSASATAAGAASGGGSSSSATDATSAAAATPAGSADIAAANSGAAAAPEPTAVPAAPLLPSLPGNPVLMRGISKQSSITDDHGSVDGDDDDDDDHQEEASAAAAASGVGGPRSFSDSAALPVGRPLLTGSASTWAAEASARRVARFPATGTPASAPARTSGAPMLVRSRSTGSAADQSSACCPTCRRTMELLAPLVPLSGVPHARRGTAGSADAASAGAASGGAAAGVGTSRRALVRRASEVESLVELHDELVVGASA